MQLLQKMKTWKVTAGGRLQTHKPALLGTSKQADKNKRKNKQRAASEPQPKAKRGWPPKKQQQKRSSERQRKAKQAVAEASEENSVYESTDEPNGLRETAPR